MHMGRNGGHMPLKIFAPTTGHRAAVWPDCTDSGRGEGTTWHGYTCGSRLCCWGTGKSWQVSGTSALCFLGVREAGAEGLNKSERRNGEGCQKTKEPPMALIQRGDLHSQGQPWLQPPLSTCSLPRALQCMESPGPSRWRTAGSKKAAVMTCLKEVVGEVPGSCSSQGEQASLIIASAGIGTAARVWGWGEKRDVVPIPERWQRGAGVSVTLRRVPLPPGLGFLHGSHTDMHLCLRLPQPQALCISLAGRCSQPQPPTLPQGLKLF